MYSREIEKIPEKLIFNGKPAFGTYSGTPKKLDIRGIHAPFAGIPLPAIFTNIRIKSSILFTFEIGDYIGTVEFFDAKAFGFAEVLFWNKETKRKFAYRSFMGPRRRFVPHKMESGFCASFKKSRYIRISWDKAQDKISVIFNLHGDSARPDVQGAILGKYSAADCNEMTTVCPAYTKSRCSATYTLTTTINGSISLGATRYSDSCSMDKCQGKGILQINRTFYNYINREESVTTAGLLGNKNISLSVSMKESELDGDNFNDNLLFVDGACTTLPPITITHPIGVADYDNKWVIQDFENMVDLTFTPISGINRTMSLLFIRARYYEVYGTLEGMVRTKDGEEIKFKNFPAIAKKQLLRV